VFAFQARGVSIMKLLIHKKIIQFSLLFFMGACVHVQGLKYRFVPSFLSLLASSSLSTNGSLSAEPVQQDQQAGYVQAITQLTQEIKVAFNYPFAAVLLAEGFNKCNQKKVTLFVQHLKQEKLLPWRSFLALFLEKALMLKESGVVTSPECYLPGDVYSKPECDFIGVAHSFLTEQELALAIKSFE
jgi:hypothetical protein